MSEQSWSERANRIPMLNWFRVERRNTHMDHEAFPLFNTKMLEIKIAKLMDTCLRNNP